MIQQVIFEDLSEEPGTLMGGIMLENGDVICGCCGGILEKADEGVTWKLVEKYDNWVDIDAAIRRKESIDDDGIT